MISTRRAFCCVSIIVLAFLPNALRAQVPAENDLVLWLDATDLPASAAGAKIAKWSDKSRHGNHVEQAATERQPMVVRDALAGHAVVRFQGQQLLDRARLAGLQTGDQPFHMLLVMRAPGNSSREAQRLLDLQSRDPGANESASRTGFWVGYQQGRKKVRLGIAHGDEGEAEGIAWDDRPHLVEAVYTGEQTFAIYLDGSRRQRALFNGKHFLGFRPQVTLAIGQHYGLEDNQGAYYEGDIAELFIYRRPLSATERFEVGSYLTGKYQLATEFRPIPRFKSDIVPILARHCHGCHGAETREAELDLRSVSTMLRGGTAGPVIVRGFPDRSELISIIESGKMPPEGEERLSKAEVQLLHDWIEADAPSDERLLAAAAEPAITADQRAHWAFQRPVRHELPRVQGMDGVRTSIDRFVLARLEERGLTYSHEADRATLIRRAFFDLIGLPPSPPEIDAFVDDKRPAAYERLIDRLLASEHFGERWGRYWLDVAGYVDVYGSDNDAAIIKPLEGKWRYRDYVIRSFNQDQPFDQFLVQQLAGDELYDWRSAARLTPQMKQALVATSFLLCANDDSDQNELNTPDVRHHVLQRTTEVIAANLLAMTVMCAKCHDHKYEAISQYDYYRLESVFAPAFNVRHWIVSNGWGRADVSDKQQVEIDAVNADVDAQIEGLKSRAAAIRDGYRRRLLAERLADLPASVREAARTAVAAAADQRNEEQQKLAARFGEKLTVQPAEIDGVLSEPHQSELAEISRLIDEQQGRRRSYGTIQVVREPNPPPPTYVLRRGNYLRPGLQVKPALLSILRDNAAATRPAAPAAGNSSGRRLALARQLTDADTLAGQYVARVLVNRIWQQVFGRGIVETSDNFGVSGTPPTHPKLLDWLTLEFIENGWRVKPLVKRMLMSTAYRQQSSAATDAGRAEEIDPANHLLWRMRMRRLDAELVRDAMLATSGKLDRAIGGPPLPLHVRPDGMVLIKQEGLPTPTSQWRRSVYVLARRNYHLTMLRIFDQPIVARNCSIRSPSAVVTQSLTLLHDDFVLEQSRYLAERAMSASADASPDQQITAAFRLALGRSPDNDEMAWCGELLARHLERYAAESVDQQQASQKAFEHVCHMLFNTNEFLYIQ